MDPAFALYEKVLKKNGQLGIKMMFSRTAVKNYFYGLVKMPEKSILREHDVDRHR